MEVGLTRPAINNYFHSKSALYDAVLCRVSNAVLDAIHTASEQRTLSEQVLTFIRIASRGQGATPPLAGFLVQSAVDVEHLPGAENDSAALIEGFLRAAVGAAQHRGELTGPPEAVTDLLVALVWGMAFQFGHSDDASAGRMLDQLRAALTRI